MKYKVDLTKVLGRGAFGTVHKAEHRNGKKVAAKRIDGKEEDAVKVVEKDLLKLKGLNHRNIAQVYDVRRDQTTVWVFMELCDQGDLAQYFKEKRQEGHRIRIREKLELMLDIARGVEYLHFKNVIHRDIKPANILFGGGAHRTAKLTDFDHSKFLEEPYSTSLMTTNAGTPAFRAPEFWIRNPQGELNYGRSVDIYAMGLTFLAMIQENKGLVPRIETPNEPSELGVSIGLVMWERQKYKTKPFEVAKLRQAEDGTTAEALEEKVRAEILKMAHIEPKQRLTAYHVVMDLLEIMKRPPPPTSHNETCVYIYLSASTFVQIRPDGSHVVKTKQPAEGATAGPEVRPEDASAATQGAEPKSKEIIQPSSFNEVVYLDVQCFNEVRVQWRPNSFLGGARAESGDQGKVIYNRQDTKDEVSLLISFQW